MFNKGDIITGKKENTYKYTTADATMRVVDAEGEQIIVEIVDHKTHKDQIGSIYWVHNSNAKFQFDELKLTRQFLNRELLAFIEARSKPTSLSSLRYDINWTDSGLKVGCQNITKADAIILAKAILENFGDEA